MIVSRIGLRSLLVLAAVTCTAASSRPARDARPLPPMTNNHIPIYPSVESFLSRQPRTRLLDQATTVHPAQRLPFVVSDEYDASMPPVGASGEPASFLRIQRAANGTARWLEGALGRVYDPATPVSEAGPVNHLAWHAQKALEVAATHARLLGLQDPRSELRLLHSRVDALGFEHHRFHQVYQGLPVWARDLYIHVNAQGMVYAINGVFEPTPGAINLTPAVPGEQAVATAREDLAREARWTPVDETTANLLGYASPSAGLVIYPRSGANHLAWEVNIRPNLLEHYTYFVDAESGEVIHRIQEHCESGFQDASANDLNNQARTIRTYQATDNSYYMVWDLPNLNQANSQLPGNPSGGILTLDARNKDITQDTPLYVVGSANNVWTDKSSVSAHHGAKVCYDYYRNTHSRKAIDDADSSIISIVNVTQNGASMPNAYWNGRAMFYGNGGSYFKPLAGAVDVAGHEMTHGVIQGSANLVYEFQSGALNESFADVFGVMVDREDLMIGEDIMLPAYGTALRDLLHPDNPAVMSRQPASMTQYLNLPASDDNGGVHSNSGIPNRAAALIINAIGREKAEKIYYRALTNYLTRSSQFADCRNAVEAAAKDLYGDGTEAAAVLTAFTTVGITGTGGGGGTDVPPVTGGQEWITFILSDGTLGIVNPATGQATTYSGDAAKVRVNEANGDRAQISTARTGERLWYVNQTGHLAYLTLANNQISTFNDLKLYQDGDIWNASISPDEAYVSLVSAYSEDPALYIYDGTDIGRIVLEPETTQDGIKDLSILYPDVVSWSPDMAHPKIAFDALHEISVNGSPVRYYGIGEINFATGRIYDLVPGQSTSTSIGNITYGNTTAANASYNLFTTAHSDIVIANFETGAATPLGMYNLTLNGIVLSDCERPTFSPTDGKVAFTSAAAKTLIFHDMVSGNKNGLTFSVPIYNPRWFVQGGVLPLTLADAAKAMRIASGLAASDANDLARLNVDTAGTSSNRISVSDAVRITRKVGKID